MFLKKLHFWGGLVLLLVFILSGQYMQHGFNRLQDLSAFERMAFRAEHIYLLLSSLIHIAVGSYFTSHPHRWGGYIQSFASTLMVLASSFFLYSFFSQMPTSEIERPFSRSGLYLMLAGVSIHGLLSLWKPKRE